MVWFVQISVWKTWKLSVCSSRCLKDMKTDCSNQYFKDMKIICSNQCLKDMKTIWFVQTGIWKTWRLFGLFKSVFERHGNYLVCSNTFLKNMQTIWFVQAGVWKNWRPRTVSVWCSEIMKTIWFVQVGVWKTRRPRTMSAAILCLAVHVHIMNKVDLCGKNGSYIMSPFLLLLLLFFFFFFFSLSLPL